MGEPWRHQPPKEGR